MSNYPKFSVATSVYKNDNPSFFVRAMRSLLEQSIVPDEIVLVVDGPVTGELEKNIRELEKEEVFHIIWLSTNEGLGNALKVAIDNCRNELIARMDSDDISLPNRFEQQLKLFEKDTAIDVVGGDITEFIDFENNIVAKRKVPINDIDIKEYMKTRCAMNHVAVMYKKISVQEAGGYLDWFNNEDYYLWIRMMEHGFKFANTGTVLVNVRVGADMYQRRGGIRYFKSEKGLQIYMLKNGLISRNMFFLNIIKRFIVQCLLPNKLRGLVFRKFARS